MVSRFRGKLHEEDVVEIADVVAIRESDKAILVLINGDEHWIPKSQIDETSEVLTGTSSGVLVIKRWLAEQKGLVE